MSGCECSESFAMAQRETVKAWHSTSMLARVDTSKFEQIASLWATPEPGLISAYLTDVAGRAYDGYALKTGLDPAKLARMGAILIRQLAKGIAPAPAPEAILAALEQLSSSIQVWITTGMSAVPVAPGAGPDDLERIAKLVGPDARMRLALLAPYAPAIASVELVVRAQLAAFPFRSPAKVFTQ